MRDHLSPHKHIKNISTYGMAPTQHLLDAGRGPQTSKKASLSHQNEVRQKIKFKKRDKGFQDGDLNPLPPREGVMKGGKVSAHSETLSRVGTGRSFGISGGNTAAGAWKAKWGDLTTEIIAEHRRPAEKWLVCLQE